MRACVRLRACVRARAARRHHRLKAETKLRDLKRARDTLLTKVQASTQPGEEVRACIHSFALPHNRTDGNGSELVHGVHFDFPASLPAYLLACATASVASLRGGLHCAAQ